MSTQSPAPASLPPLDISYEDDPKVVEQAATEDYSLHVVPRTWRIDRVQLTMAWWAVMTAFFYLYFASFLALAYGTVNALIGIALSVIVYTLVNTVIVRTASRSGLTVALFCRSMFGFVGRVDRDADLRRDIDLLRRLRGLGRRRRRADVLRRPDQALVRDRDHRHRPAGLAGRARLAGQAQRAACCPSTRSADRRDRLGARRPGLPRLPARREGGAGTTLPWLQAFAAYMGVWILMMFTMDFARLARPEDERYHIGDHVRLAVLPADVPGQRPRSASCSCRRSASRFEELAGQESALPV